MTAEIAILNKQAIALAADSAITVTRGGKRKIFLSANKIFALSKYYPVGIMIYGNAELMFTPWETIIKIYREQLGDRSFNKLEDYAVNFFKFLSKANNLFPARVQKMYLEFKVNVYYKYYIYKEIGKKIESFTKAREGKGITRKDSLKIVSDVIKKHYNIWERANFNPSANEGSLTALKNKYRNDIAKLKKSIFEKIPLTQTLSNYLTEIAASMFSKHLETVTYDSGIVVAGFGKKDIFPSLHSFLIDGLANGKLVYRTHKDTKVSRGMNAGITPFAQSAAVETFMEGIEPKYSNFVREHLLEIFESYPNVIIDSIKKLTPKEKDSLKKKTQKVAEEIGRQYIEKFKSYELKTFVHPILRVVASLPKDELATMAETLVNLTSFKQRISEEEAETVAGPIDVAVISKGDGFVWIKRKHYFKPELNARFLRNYYKERKNEK